MTGMQTQKRRLPNQLRRRADSRGTAHLPDCRMVAVESGHKMNAAR